MILDYVCGGELFSYLRNSGRFTSSAGLCREFFFFLSRIEGFNLSAPTNDDAAMKVKTSRRRLDHGFVVVI